MQLVNIGFGNMISAERMIAIVSRNPRRLSASCRIQGNAAP